MLFGISVEQYDASDYSLRHSQIWNSILYGSALFMNIMDRNCHGNNNIYRMYSKGYST